VGFRFEQPADGQHARLVIPLPDHLHAYWQAGRLAKGNR